MYMLSFTRYMPKSFPTGYSSLLLLTRIFHILINNFIDILGFSYKHTVYENSLNFSFTT